jgi:hypothetical protein
LPNPKATVDKTSPHPRTPYNSYKNFGLPYFLETFSHTEKNGCFGDPVTSGQNAPQNKISQITVQLGYGACKTHTKFLETRPWEGGKFCPWEFDWWFLG